LSGIYNKDKCTKNKNPKINDHSVECEIWTNDEVLKSGLKEHGFHSFFTPKKTVKDEFAELKIVVE